MYGGRRSRGRITSDTPEMVTHFNSIDTSSDLLFFTGNINTNDIFLWLLLSGLITNESFSALYNRSELVGWREVFIDLRNHLKLDEKSKPKRMALNRLIREYSTRADHFTAKAMELHEEMKKQLSTASTPEQDCSHRFKTMNDVYREVNIWRQLQCDRRIFYQEYNRRRSFPALQQFMTSQFISLVPFFPKNIEAVKELLDHCLIIVAQPSGTDCFAVTKYEKVGEAFFTKIKTRIICLLDPNQVRPYVELSDVAVTLYVKNRELDSNGDVQSALQWKTRSIKYDDDHEQIFWYIELDENDAISLTKRMSNGKLLYNNQLCQLVFQMKFEFVGTNIEIPVTFNSQFFGLCSHAKHNPKFLAKVFLEETKEMYPAINQSTHMKILETYIYRLHRRISGVDAKPHTQQFIQQKLNEVYEVFCTSSPKSFTIDIYENLLVELFRQMKFMGSHPFLPLMYSDSLFLGIITDAVDGQLDSRVSNRPQLIMRIALPAEQQTSENTNIIFAVHNGTLYRSRATHNYLISDISACICAAAQNQGNQIQVCGENKVSPFSDFERYYDLDLSHENFIQTTGAMRYHPLSALLHNRIQNHPTPRPISTEQQETWHTFNLIGRLQGDKDLIGDAINFLEEQLAHFCATRHVVGSLTRNPLDDMETDDDA